MGSPTYSDAFTFLPQGAIIQEFKVAGKNIVLGFDSAEPYKTANSAYFGETIGRVANRIANAKIDNLNGKSYSLVANNGPNALHGGILGWGKRDFEGPTPVTRNGRDAVLFKYLSKDGEEGYPGTVELRLWYIPYSDKTEDVEKTTLEIEYEVELVGDEVNETVVNLTNHSYFNISDGPTIEGIRATLATNMHMAADGNDLPTGEIIPYPGINANEEFVFGASEPAVDHCFIVNNDPASILLDTRKQPLAKICQFYHPDTKIHLEALSTEPAFQLYAGKYIDVPATGSTPARGARSGFCVEASRYINAINDEKLRHMVVLKKGELYGSRTVYRSWKQ